MLSQFYPPIMGGVERHVQSLSKALAARGHQVAVATLQHGGQAEFEVDDGVRVYRIRGTMQRFARLLTAGRQHSPPFPDPEVTNSLRHIIAKEDPEIVHAHNWMIYSFLPIKAGTRAKVVMTLHDCELACAQMRMMYMDTKLCSGPWFAKCLKCSIHHYGLIKGVITLSGNWSLSVPLHTNVDMFLPVSRAVAAVNQLTGSRTPYQVVPNFVPDNISACLKDLDTDARLSVLPGEDFILQVGDLSIDKGIGVLLDAYVGLSSAPPLVLIGRRLAESPKDLPSNVIVIDGLPHDLVMRAWQRSLFGTVPSLCMDACPTVTMEAMASRRPVIGSNIGGIQDQIVDGETGFLVPAGDVVELRHAMEKLIADPGMRQRMGTKGSQRLQEFVASTVVKDIESVYKSLWNQAS